MSRINGEKARAALQRRRRTAQRAKDRIAVKTAAENPPPAPKPLKVKKAKPAAEEAPAAEVAEAAKPAAKKARAPKA